MIPRSPVSRTARATRSRCVAVALLSCVVAPIAAHAEPGTAADADAGVATEGVRALRAEALARHPGLESMRARTRELEVLSTTVDVWPDPLLSVEYSNAPVDTFSIGDHPMGGVEIRLMQRLPEWGWGEAERAVASHTVAGSRYRESEAALGLARTVETLYWRLTLSRLLEDVTRAHLDRTRELQDAVRVRYEVGESGQNELLRMDVLRQRLEDDLADFDRAERALSAGLARALARPEASRFETPDRVEAIAPTGDAGAWIERARADRPELAAIREEVERGRRAASLARVRGRPEIDLWVKYRVRTFESATDDGVDMFSAGVAIPIPWGSRKRAKGEAAAGLAASDGAQARLAAALDRMESALVTSDAEWRRAAQKADAYEQRLLPAARSVLETSLAEFAVGKADFATLYEAEVELLGLERSHLEAVVETRIQRAAVMALTGELDAGGDS